MKKLILLTVVAILLGITLSGEASASWVISGKVFFHDAEEAPCATVHLINVGPCLGIPQEVRTDCCGYYRFSVPEVDCSYQMWAEFDEEDQECDECSNWTHTNCDCTTSTTPETYWIDGDRTINFDLNCGACDNEDACG
jgi:hypothetical protein